MVTKKKPKRRGAPIKRPVKQLTPAEQRKLSNEAAGISTDASQLARAIINHEYARARTQQKSIIKRIQKLKL